MDLFFHFIGFNDFHFPIYILISHDLKHGRVFIGPFELYNRNILKFLFIDGNLKYNGMYILFCVVDYPNVIYLAILIQI